jgi:hypothetical protein
MVAWILFEVLIFQSEVLGGIFKYSLIGIEELHSVLIKRYEIQYVLLG